MKRYYCQCGNQVFFENSHCVSCGRVLGFDPGSMEILALVDSGEGVYTTADNRAFRLCGNRVEFDVCNWLRPVDSAHSLCSACQFNRTVPNQTVPHNQNRWKRLEEAKKRLFFTLMRLGIPLVDGWRDPENGLLLDFLEDNREVSLEGFVSTGYLGGVITINTLEADDVARVSAKSQLNELYRTVLGHLRHESGHYYWARLATDNRVVSEFSDLFGDPTADYQSALSQYYQNGPRKDWRVYHISAYASAHPAEDWAETWGHYLHIYDALETAAEHQLIEADPSQMSITERISIWRKLSITLNELNRSVGRQDAYPFVINSLVESKLIFVDRMVSYLRTDV